MDNPERNQKLVQEDVIYCVSSLIGSLYPIMENLDSEEQEALLDLSTSSRDWEGPAREADWISLPDDGAVFTHDDHDPIPILIKADPEEAERLFHDRLRSDHPTDDEEEFDDFLFEWDRTDEGFFNTRTEEFSDALTWEELCQEQGIDPYEHEAYEHWIVSNWLGRKLSEHGETVRELLGMTIWARGTTGQAIYIDGVISEIVKELYEE